MGDSGESGDLQGRRRYLHRASPRRRPSRHNASDGEAQTDSKATRRRERRIALSRIFFMVCERVTFRVAEGRAFYRMWCEELKDSLVGTLETFEGLLESWKLQLDLNQGF